MLEPKKKKAFYVYHNASKRKKRNKNPCFFVAKELTPSSFKNLVNKSKSKKKSSKKRKMLMAQMISILTYLDIFFNYDSSIDQPTSPIPRKDRRRT